MSEPLQPIVIKGDYTVTADDNGKLIEVASAGSISFPFGLPPGFYVTIVNVGGGTVRLVALGGAQIRSSTGGQALTTQWQSTTVYRRALSTELVAMGVP